MNKHIWVSLSAIAMMLAACANTPTNTPTALPTPIVATAAAPGNDDWSRVKAAGKLLVGTSADYEPFDYYNAARQLDGFDIALMKEIGKKLGVTIELSDYAFDGLGGALTLGQADAAIAALSVTPDRQQVLGFSDVYFTSDEAILANASSPITSVKDPKDLVGKRIGVQTGSVYETFIEKNYILPGIVPQSDVYSFGQVDHAVQAMRDNRVDVVVMDDIVSQTYLNQGGLKVVSRGNFPQRYAIATRLGSTLIPQLNSALQQLSSEGVIAALAKQYLQISSLKPLPTSPPLVPTAPPQVLPTAPASRCTDGMTLVQDLNYDDNNMQSPPVVQPGTPFRKGWRLQNSGTCTWTTAYALSYVFGNVPAARMGGVPVTMTFPVEPGQTVDVFVGLVAPLQPGVYQGFWQMFNAAGSAFGQRVWVGITVPAQPTSTPAPTTTPLPNTNIVFTANPINISQGQCSLFNWVVTNARAVYFFAQGEDYRNHLVPASSQRTVCPQFTTPYNLRVERSDGTPELRTITIFVTQTPSAPQIAQFTLVPAGTIQLGTCTTVYWSVSGDVTNIQLTVNGASLLNGAPLSGNFVHCPPNAGGYTYNLVATGPGGTNQSSQFLNVTQSSPTIVPTPIPPNGPAILGFNLNPTTISEGGCTSLTWNIVNATYISIKRDGLVVFDNAPPNSSLQDCPGGNGVRVYQAFASGNGVSTSADQTLTITPR